MKNFLNMAYKTSEVVVVSDKELEDSEVFFHVLRNGAATISEKLDDLSQLGTDIGIDIDENDEYRKISSCCEDISSADVGLRLNTDVVAYYCGYLKTAGFSHKFKIRKMGAPLGQLVIGRIHRYAVSWDESF